jgi:hypothetical protein
MFLTNLFIDQAIALKFRLLSIRLTSEVFETNWNIQLSLGTLSTPQLSLTCPLASA